MGGRDPQQGEAVASSGQQSRGRGAVGLQMCFFFWSLPEKPWWGQSG